jgi:thymidine kinase
MLQITIGPMYAGKTSLLMKEYNICSGKKVIIDFNIGEGNCLLSVLHNHDGAMLDCVKAKQLYDTLVTNEICDLVKSSDHIFINEAQFFPDLFKFVVESKKNIYLYGLDGDYKREPIGDILNLIPYCDSVIKLRAKCTCGKPAIYTRRESYEEEQYAPHAKYVPNCRVCYSNKK